MGSDGLWDGMSGEDILDVLNENKFDIQFMQEHMSTTMKSITIC